MKITKLFTLTTFLVSAGIFLFGGCQDGTIAPITSGGSELSDTEQLQKLIEEDEIIQSFEPNYNEEEAMSLAGDGLAKAIFPVKIGHRMTLVNRNIDIEIIDDSAFASVTSTFEGILYIAASYDDFKARDLDVVDTLIEKQFTSVVTHNVIFRKRDNWGLNFFSDSDRVDPRETDVPSGNPGGLGDLYIWHWKIVSVSLPEGGTGSANIFITKLTLTLPDGEEIVVESPNDYYMERIPGRPHQIPSFSQGETILVKLELQSVYSDTDFVCLTFGARHGARHLRVKKCLELVSEEFDGQFYSRVYEQEWISRPDRGPKHAVVRVVPKQVVFDDETIVEVNTWGVPYIVK